MADDIHLAMANGDYGQVLTDMLYAPATITGGFLNGYDGPDADLFNFTPYGLLTYDGGPNGDFGTIQLLLYAEERVADSITVLAPPAASAAAVPDLSLPHDWLGAFGGIDPALGLGQLSADLAGVVGTLSADLGPILASLIP